MTNILDKNTLSLIFMDVERLNDTNDHIKTLFRFKRLKFKDGVEDSHQLGSLEDLSD